MTDSTIRLDLIPDREAVIAVYRSAGLNRPYAEPDRIQAMLDNSDIIATAWQGQRLIGIGRAITDYTYCCYLSDLAVTPEFQRQGVGRALLEAIRAKLGDEVSIILHARSGAESYYPGAGYEALSNCFVSRRIR